MVILLVATRKSTTVNADKQWRRLFTLDDPEIENVPAVGSVTNIGMGWRDDLSGPFLQKGTCLLERQNPVLVCVGQWISFQGTAELFVVFGCDLAMDMNLNAQEQKQDKGDGAGGMDGHRWKSFYSFSVEEIKTVGGWARSFQSRSETAAAAVPL